MRPGAWVASALLACRTMQPASDAPAVLVNPSADGRAELSRAVSGALGGAPVTLADDALVHDSVLIVERTPRRDPNGLLAQGRELGAPERFRLVMTGGRCVLVHEGTGQRIELAASTCASR